MGEYVPYRKLKKIIADKKRQGKKVVLTGGCFDILHPGHIYLFRKSKEIGDILVVNVVNDKLAGTLAKHYGFKTMEDNGQGGVIMTN